VGLSAPHCAPTSVSSVAVQALQTTAEQPIMAAAKQTVESSTSGVCWGVLCKRKPLLMVCLQGPASQPPLALQLAEGRGRWVVRVLRQQACSPRL
jgi:hypothetical protein